MAGNIGFNRYIVECKSVLSTLDVIVAIGFNRYIVECKYQIVSKMFPISKI